MCLLPPALLFHSQGTNRAASSTLPNGPEATGGDWLRTVGRSRSMTEQVRLLSFKSWSWVWYCLQDCHPNAHASFPCSLPVGAVLPTLPGAST